MQAVAHFASLGYCCPPLHNPADFFLRLVTACELDTTAASNFGLQASSAPLSNTTRPVVDVKWPTVIELAAAFDQQVYGIWLRNLNAAALPDG